MTDYICGQTIITQYNNRTYKIDDLRLDMSPESKFDFNGVKITFTDYMLKRYNLILKHID